MFELTQYTITLPTLTDPAIDFLFGFLVFWVCMGTLSLFLASIADMFHPDTHSSQSLFKIATLSERALVMIIATFCWPVLLFVTYTVIKEIREDLDERYEETCRPWVENFFRSRGLRTLAKMVESHEYSRDEVAVLYRCYKQK